MTESVAGDDEEADGEKAGGGGDDEINAGDESNAIVPAMNIFGRKGVGDREKGEGKRENPLSLLRTGLSIYLLGTTEYWWTEYSEGISFLHLFIPRPIISTEPSLIPAGRENVIAKELKLQG